VLRAWWDGQDHPSIECPLGDFFGTAQGKVMAYCSAMHSIGPSAGMNLWLPMPFTKRARFDFVNETDKSLPLFYQITYTLGDKHADDVGRLHTLFRRENPTTLKKDFELLPLRKQKGRYVGAVIGVRNLHPDQWWAKGRSRSTWTATRSFPPSAAPQRGLRGHVVGPSAGAVLVQRLQPGPEALRVDVSLAPGRPIAWQRECRITIQQIAWKKGLQETQDDWSCATFWYEPVPARPCRRCPT